MCFVVLSAVGLVNINVNILHPLSNAHIIYTNQKNIALDGTYIISALLFSRFPTLLIDSYDCILCYHYYHVHYVFYIVCLVIIITIVYYVQLYYL